MDDQIFSYPAVAGSFYNITGVNFLSFGDVKIYPRSIADIEVTGTVSVAENTAEVNLYPNPATHTVRVNSPANATIAIYNMTGALVYSELSVATSTLIDVEALNTGVYQVVVTENNTTSTTRLIVE